MTKKLFVLSLVLFSANFSYAQESTKSQTPDFNTQASEPAVDTKRAPEKPVDNSPPKTTEGWRFALGLFFSSAESLKFDSVNVATGGTIYSGSASYDLESVDGIFGEAILSDPHSWGVDVGLSIDGRRHAKSYTLSSYNYNSSGSLSGDMALTVITIYANAIYRWDWFYIPFGINVSSVKVDNPTVAMQDLHGGVGVQLGVGFRIHDHVFLELMSRAVSVRGSNETLGSTSVDIGTGYLTGGEFIVKVLF